MLAFLVFFLHETLWMLMDVHPKNRKFRRISIGIIWDLANNSGSGRTLGTSGLFPMVFPRFLPMAFPRFGPNPQGTRFGNGGPSHIPRPSLLLDDGWFPRGAGHHRESNCRRDLLESHGVKKSWEYWWVNHGKTNNHGLYWDNWDIPSGELTYSNGKIHHF